MILDGKLLARNLSRRGRNRTASPTLRANGYRDENGRYQLSDGLKHWHLSIVDYMIANPRAKVKDLAKVFNVSPQWMGQVLKADAFVEYYQERMRTHQGVVHTEIVSKLQTVATQAIDTLGDRLEKEPDKLSVGAVKDTADMALKALGYTSHGNGGAGVTVNVPAESKGTTVTVETDVIARARDTWQKHNEARNVTPTEKELQENHQYVTSSLEVSVEDVEVDDAVIVDPEES